MEKKAVSGMLLALLLVGVLTCAFNIEPAEAVLIIYIMPDGSINPPTAPIRRDGLNLYTLTGNISGQIWVQRNFITIDGAGYTVQDGNYAFKLAGAMGGTNVTIENTNMGPAMEGVELNPRCYRVNISKNNMTNCHYGIVGSCLNSSIVGNNITNNMYAGIRFSSSSNNSIVNNVFVNCSLFFQNSFENVVEDNTVNGKPLVYLEGVSDYVVNDAGYVMLVNCHNIRVENLNLSNIGVGIELYGTDSSTIIGNNITANSSPGGTAITLLYSSYNSLVQNNINNNYRGISLDFSSDYNIISENNVTNNANGIALYNSTNNAVDGNNITNNGNAIYLAQWASNNVFRHNNFIANAAQVYMGDGTVGQQFWDNYYPDGGNYWSDYTGDDVYSGPFQDEPGSDGIGDTPYVIDTSNQDNYPLMNHYIAGDINHDGIVNSSDLSALAPSYGADSESPDWNAGADINHDGIIDVRDLFGLGRNYGET